jgi:hypothetical protein
MPIQTACSIAVTRRDETDFTSDADTDSPSEIDDDDDTDDDVSLFDSAAEILISMHSCGRWTLKESCLKVNMWLRNYTVIKQWRPVTE